VYNEVINAAFYAFDSVCHMKPFIGILICIFLLGSFPIAAQSRRAQKPELIRDTGIAEGKHDADESAPLEYDPERALQNISIGNFYFKRGNFIAAIARYLDALRYDEASVPAYEALARAYERNGEPSKAIQSLKTFVEMHPDSPKSSEFSRQIIELEQRRN
jgi:tetratricopeptide (TPR) repeat protein